MKKYLLSYLFPALLLGCMSVSFVACGDDDEDENLPTQKETVVEIDEQGKANGNHTFVQIDESNFYVDDIKYTAENGVLSVTGYNISSFKGYYKWSFQGEARIIDALVFQGRRMMLRSIGKYAFYDTPGVTDVIIPNSVTSIGDYAFSGCTGLTSITIPNGVISIGKLAFLSCDGLTSITIGNGVASIGDGAFYDCIRLASIKVDSKNTVYDSRDNCNAIIETKTNKLLFGCSQTKIPKSVTTIGDFSFRNCRNLTSITIPQGVTSIGRCAFYVCNALTSATIPEGVTSIGDGAFQDCSSLTSITIPNSVTSLGGTAFKGCQRLTSVIIGSGIRIIGEYAFDDCSSLKDIFCYAENPPQVIGHFKEPLLSRGFLHVPAASKEAYMTSYPWSGFERIVSIE